MKDVSGMLQSSYKDVSKLFIQYIRHGLIILLEQVNVGVIGDFHRCMPQEFADDFDLDAACEQKAGKGMPQRMNAIAGQAGVAQDDLKRTLKIRRHSRRADGVQNDIGRTVAVLQSH